MHKFMHFMVHEFKTLNKTSVKTTTYTIYSHLCETIEINLLEEAAKCVGYFLSLSLSLLCFTSYWSLEEHLLN